MNRIKYISILIAMSLTFLGFSQNKVSQFSVYFNSSSAELSAKEKEKIQAEINELTNLKSAYSVEVIGYSDQTGKANTNLLLSQRRSKAVKNIFIQNGYSKTSNKGMGSVKVKTLSEADKAKNRRVDVLIRTNVKKPTSIAGYKVKTDEYSFECKKGTHINYKSGSEITVPPNAFVDQNGNDVQGKVTLKYVEFRDPVDIMLSGIPMSFEKNGRLQHFSSSGMYTIKALQNGKPVQVKPGKEIKIDFKLVQQQPELAFFNLDKEEQWNEKAKIDFKDSIPQMRITHGFVFNENPCIHQTCGDYDLVKLWDSVYTQNGSLVDATKKRLDLMGNKSANYIIKIHGEYMKDFHKWNSNFRSASNSENNVRVSFSFDIETKNKNIEEFKPNNPQALLDAQNEIILPKGKVKFEIKGEDKYNATANPIEPIKGIKFYIETENPDSVAKLLKNNKNTSLVRNNKGAYTLTIRERDRSVYCEFDNVKPVRSFNPKNLFGWKRKMNDKMNQTATLSRKYDRTIAKYVRKTDSARKKYLRAEKKYREIDTLFQAAKFIDSLSCYASILDISKTSEDEPLKWAQYHDDNRIEMSERFEGYLGTVGRECEEAALARKEQRRKEKLMAKTKENMKLELGISATGTYNADAIKQIKSPIQVIAKYVDGSGKKLKINQISVMDETMNGVINYNGYAGYSPYKFVMSKKHTSCMFAFDTEMNAYLINRNDFKKIKADGLKGNMTFTLTKVNPCKSKADLEMQI